MTQKEFITVIILGIITMVIAILIVIAVIAYLKRKDQYERFNMTYIRVADGFYVNFVGLLLVILFLIIACIMIAITTKIDQSILNLYYKTP